MASTIASSRTTPLDFSLRNQQGQHVLYTRVPEQDLVLELRNNSGAELHIPASSSNDEPTEKDCHFQLLFRSGTLWEAEKVKLGGDNAQAWKLSRPSVKTTRDVAFYLSYKGTGSDPLKLPTRGDTKLTLAHIGVDGRGGSRGTRVELMYQNLKFAGVEAPPSGTLMHYLAVMDESPADEPANVPILIDWHGPNTFLNDGTPTTRTLRLFNNTGRTLEIQQAAKITIDVPVGTDSTGFALIAESEKADLVVEAVKDWTRANKAQWPIELTPTAGNLKLEANQSLDIPIKLQTTLRSGPSWIAVGYEGFEHLEGKRRVPVMKTSLVVAENGGVGIGWTNPDKKLWVNGDAVIREGAVIGNVTIGQMRADSEYGSASYETIGAYTGSTNLRLQSHRSIMFHTGSNQPPAERVVIDDNGNLGIGVQPNEKLSVDGTAKITKDLTCEQKIKAKELEVDGAAKVTKDLTCEQNIKTKGLEVDGTLTVTKNVGIGTTTTPGFPLNFPGTLGDKISLYGYSGPHYGFGIQGNLLQIHGSEVNADIAFGYGSSSSFTETMRITSSHKIYGTTHNSPGSLLIGGNSPSSMMVSAGYTEFAKLNSHAEICNDSETVGFKALMLVGNSSRKLGADRWVQVYDNLEVHKDLYVSGSIHKKFGDTFSALERGTGNNWQWAWWSDLRLKRDVQPVASALTKVRQLRGVTFNWTDEAKEHFTRGIETMISAGPSATDEEHQAARSTERQRQHDELAKAKVGVIAQEVEAVLPEAVITDADGYKSVQYDNLIPLLIEAIKEQDRLVTRQQAEIERLKRAAGISGPPPE